MRTLIPGRLWPGGIVPLWIDAALPQATRDKIRIAKEFFNTVPGLEFPDRTTEANFIYFVQFNPLSDSGTAGNSALGMQPGLQRITLTRSTGAGSIAHELCHALGLLHEHMRSDRDSFIVINWQNIKPSKLSQFQTAPGEPTQNIGRYDYGSIMHYTLRAFAKRRGLQTMSVHPDKTAEAAGITIGQRTQTSGRDRLALNEMYPPFVKVNEWSSNGPSIARKGNRFLIAFKGNGDDNIYTTASDDAGGGWSGTVNISEHTSDTPALAALGDHFFLAWKGGNNKLNIMSSQDGRSWGSKVTLNESSPSTPALARVGAALFLAWQGMDDRLNVKRSVNGSNWPPHIPLSETTTCGPALCKSGLDVLLAWRGKGNNKLNIMRGPLGVFSNLSPMVTLHNEKTDDKPALCSRGAKAFLAWRGENNGLFNVMSSLTGASWGNKFTSEDVCHGNPAIAGWGSSALLRAWTDPNSKELRTKAFSHA